MVGISLVIDMAVWGGKEGSVDFYFFKGSVTEDSSFTYAVSVWLTLHRYT